MRMPYWHNVCGYSEWLDRVGMGKGTHVHGCIVIFAASLNLPVSSLSNAGRRLSTLVATDLRETLHDTILDAMRGESKMSTTIIFPIIAPPQ